MVFIFSLKQMSSTGESRMHHGTYMTLIRAWTDTYLFRISTKPSPLLTDLTGTLAVSSMPSEHGQEAEVGPD